jgi:hypothetical protein
LTSRRCLFRLAEQLAIAHERSAPGAITVIPVVVDDLGSLTPVLEAFCNINGEGRLFNATDERLQSPVAGTSDVTRIAALQAALSIEGGAMTRRVVIFPSGSGRLDATFEPIAGADPSAGERTVLAVARAVAHRDFDDRELAVLAYSESGIDYPFRRGLWSLGVHQLAGLPHHTLRTLILVVESDIDVDLHCQEGRGFQFAIQQSRLLRRHDHADLGVAARRIATYEGPIVFFLGAGFAASSRLPLGNALRDDAVRRLLDIPKTDVVPSDELGVRFHRWVSTKEGWLTESEQEMREDDFARQLTLEQVVRIERRVTPELPTLEAFRARHDEVVETPGSAVRDLCHTLQHMVCRAVVVEVNFDQLVERHCPVQTRVFYSAEQFDDAASYLKHYLERRATAIPVLKLHGSIEAPGTCVVSDEQMQKGIGDGKLAALQRLVGTQAQPLRWIYVGASMRDRDLLPVLRLEQFGRGTDETWVMPYLDASVEAFAVERARLHDKEERRWISDRLVTETADAFFRALRKEFS